MIQESHLRALGFTFLLCYSTASPFSAAQPSSNTDSAREDDSLDSATMAILVLVVVSALLFLGSFSLWIQRCCDSPISYTRSETFRSAIFAGGGSRVRRGGDESSAAESVRGVDKAAIDSFPTFVYSEVKDLKIGVGSLECAVCLNEFSGEEILKLLPSCDHVFHPICIATWLANHTTCPVCRAKVAGNRGNPVKMERIPLDTANNSNQDSFSADAESNSRCKPRAEEMAGDAKTGMASSVSGESAIQHAGDYERFTLKLPDGVREQIAKAGSKLKRSASCEHLPGVSSSKRGFSDGGDGSGSHLSRWLGRSERWVSSVAPSDCLSVKEEVAGNRSDQLPV